MIKLDGRHTEIENAVISMFDKDERLPVIDLMYINQRWIEDHAIANEEIMKRLEKEGSL